MRRDVAVPARPQAASIVKVAVDGQLAGMLAIAYPVRPSAAVAIVALRSEGLRVLVLTGDGQDTAAAVFRASEGWTVSRRTFARMTRRDWATALADAGRWREALSSLSVELNALRAKTVMS